MKKSKNILDDIGIYFKEMSALNKKKYIVVSVFSFIFLVIFIIYYSFSFPYLKLQYEEFDVSLSAPSDIILDKDIEFIDQEENAKKILLAQEELAPVYSVDLSIVEKNKNSFYDFSEKLLDSHKKNIPFSNFYEDLDSEYKKLFSRKRIESIYRLSDKKLSNFIKDSKRIMNLFLDNYEIIDFTNMDLQKQKEIVIARNKNKNISKKELEISNVITMDNLYSSMMKILMGRNLKSDIAKDYIIFLKPFLESNTFFDEVKTKKAKKDISKNIEPVMLKYKAGERIIRENSIITSEQMKVVEYLKNNLKSFNPKSILGVVIFLIIITLLIFFTLKESSLDSGITLNQIIVFYSNILIFTILTILYKTFVYENYMFFGLLLPVALFSMIDTILSDMKSAIYINITVVISFLIIFNLNIVTVTFMIFTTIFSSIVIDRTEKRIDIIVSGFLIGLFQSVLIFSILLLQNYGYIVILKFILVAFFNGLFSSILVLGVLPIFEHTLNIPTSFMLMELTDTNLPIFKKMLTMAPGTHAHTLAVANLAEAAAREIGANALLTRAGAYYHDIGKIEHPEFFAENQRGDNKHDDLDPNLSKTVIKAHVTDGVNKMKEMKMPKAITDIVEQHHGNGTINYFYVRALMLLENNQNSKINDSLKKQLTEEYRYKTPTPKTREAGIVMLADVVEAASRSLKAPTIQKLEKFIDKIVADKINSHQLDDCDLTFKQIESIKKIFLKILTSTAHIRPEYPHQKKEGNE